MIMKTILIVCSLLVLSLCQSCEEVNATDVNQTQFGNSTFIYQSQQFNGTVLVCTCPDSAIFHNQTQTCECLEQNQEFIGDSCQCSAGYDWNETHCISCPYPCQVCSENGTCDTCQEGYIMTETNCTEAPADIDGIYMGEDGEWYQCPGGCSVCDLDSCWGCKEGFYQVQKWCVPCSNTGLKCQSCSEGFGCLSCYEGYFENMGNCLSCPENCLKCNGRTCNQCIQGFYPDGNHCFSCSDSGCKTCPRDHCIDCAVGYAMIGGECIPCLFDCNYCSSVNPTICFGCATGYYLNINDECTPCQLQCQECQSQLICTSCSQGYKLQGSKCVRSCIFPCQDCLEQGNLCSNCYGGYTFDANNSKCEPDLSCNENGTCSSCPREYYQAENLTCLECNIKNCVNCRDNEGELECVKCQPGFGLADVFGCEVCPQGCLTCQTGAFCSTCSEGYFLYKKNHISTGKCYACSIYDHCLSCRGSASHCVSCLFGYRLHGSKCISESFIELKIVLNIEPRDFYDRINDFIDDILERIGIFSRSALTINSITSGSTHVNAMISIANPQDMDYLPQKLQKSLNDNPSVSQIDLISSTVSSASFRPEFQREEGLEDQQKVKTVRVGLIVGLTVLGGAVIVLLIVVLIQVRKGKGQDIQPQDPTGQQMNQKKNPEQVFHLSE